jgi:hypothetical protein
MSDFTDFHTLALAEVIALLGTTIVYKGTTYNAIVNDVELSNDLQDGGFTESLASIVILQKSDIATAPKAGETLTINGKKARIESVRQDEVAYELHCKTATK